MKEEIYSGLKNALERGNSLDSAVKSFILAGYNPIEVQEAASALSSGATSIINQQPQFKNTLYQKPSSTIQTNTNIPSTPQPVKILDNNIPLMSPPYSPSPTPPVTSQQNTNQEGTNWFLIILISLIVLFGISITILLFYNPEILTKIKDLFV